MEHLRRLILSLSLAVTGIFAAGATDEWPRSHFAWGADISSAIDMSAQDLSTINLSAAFGYKSRVVQMAGVGGAMEIGVGKSARMFPVFAICRTSFSPTAQRCFLEVKAGWSFNNLPDEEKTTTGFYGSVGWGINLAMNSNYRSYFLVAYTYRQMSSSTYNDVHAVTAGIGMNF
jgi:hypothetical protein